MAEMTWEERMAAKAAARRPVEPDYNPDNDPDVQAAIERGRERTYERAAADNTCTECFEPYLDGHHGWRLRVTCGITGCPHEHHRDEVWIA